MKTLLASLLALALISPIFANDQNDDKSKPAEQDPVAWGFLGSSHGCVIFKEYSRTKGKVLGVAGKTKTVSGLEVIETQNYSMSQKKWVENQDDLNELQRRALKDSLTYVKIQENYSPALLEKARALCKQPSGPE